MICFDIFGGILKKSLEEIPEQILEGVFNGILGGIPEESAEKFQKKSWIFSDIFVRTSKLILAEIYVIFLG